MEKLSSLPVKHPAPAECQRRLGLRALSGRSSLSYLWLRALLFCDGDRWQARAISRESVRSLGAQSAGAPATEVSPGLPSLQGLAPLACSPVASHVMLPPSCWLPVGAAPGAQGLPMSRVPLLTTRLSASFLTSGEESGKGPRDQIRRPRIPSRNGAVAFGVIPHVCHSRSS